MEFGPFFESSLSHVAGGDAILIEGNATRRINEVGNRSRPSAGLIFHARVNAHLGATSLYRTWRDVCTRVPTDGRPRMYMEM